jgi:hypothetical protein
MPKTIGVIGLGSLGGFICKHLAGNHTVTKLVIVDYDLVTSQNTLKSIYRPKDIGANKVDALEDILKSENFGLEVAKINSEYIEGQTKLPKCDLLIDCRDFVCDRLGEIDVRVYISGRDVIIDCRKMVCVYKPYQGEYNLQLNKSEISKAAFLVSDLIIRNKFSSLIQNSSVERINIDLLDELIKTSIEQQSKDQLDIIYDDNKFTKKITRLDQAITPTIYMNSKDKVEVILGPIRESIFPGSLKEPSDVIRFMGRFVERYGHGKNYIIFVNKINKTLEFIEETGAA